MLFQIIATFEDGDQDIFEIDLGYVNDEKNFITNILDSLDDEKIKDLIKLSICHYKKDSEQNIEWLINRYGKYYFNYETNNDDDTKEWYDFKNNYLNNILNL
jgi:hypothetical protein